MNKHIALLAAAGLVALAPMAWGQGPGGPGPAGVGVRRSGGCGGPPRVVTQSGPGRVVFIRRMAWRDGRGGHGAWARPGGMGMHPGMMGMIAHWSMLKRRVGLSAEQAQKLSDAFFTWRKTRIMDRANQQVRRLEVARLMMAPQPDEAAVDHQLARIEQQRLASAQAGVHFRLTIRRVLTPEQWRRLQALHGRMRMRMGDRRGGMWGGRMPSHQPMPQKPMMQRQ